MRITDLYLDGFGVYNQESINDLPDGLAVFIGKNESGKTTLMEFIRTMIFGFPSGRVSKLLNTYPPLGNGMHGGKLELQVNNGGRYIINRMKKNVTITDATGQLCNFEPSSQWLGGLDRATYQKVFAVGLSDLQGLELLSQDNVRSRFFAAGAGSGGASLVSSICKIDNQLAQLLLARGREQRLNKLLKEVEEINKDLREARKDEIQYSELESKRGELIREIAQAEKQSTASRVRYIELEQLERAWEPWTELEWQREKAQSLEFAKEFPPSGIVRLEQLLQQIDEYTGTVRNKSREKEKFLAESNQLTLDRGLVAIAADIERLYGQKGRFETDLQSYPSQKTETDMLAIRYQQALAEIGPEWDDAMLVGVNVSVPMRQKVQAYATQLRTLDSDLKRSEIAEKQAIATLADLREELAKHQAAQPNIDSTVQSEQQAEFLEEGLRTLRQAILQQQQCATGKLATDKEALEVAAGLSNLAMQETGYGSAMPGWLWMATLVLSLSVAGFLFWQGSFLASLVAAPAGLSLTLVLAKQTKRQDEARRAWLRQMAQERQRLLLRQSEIRQEISAIDSRLREKSRLVTATAGQMRVAIPATPEDLDQLERQINKARRDYQSWQLYQTRAQELQTKVDKLQTAGAQLLQQKSLALAKSEAGCREWEDWLAQRHFSVDSSPEGFEIVLKAIETARNAREQAHNAKGRLQSLSEYIAGIKGEIETLVSRCGRKIPKAISAKELEVLYQELMTARTQERRKTYLGEMTATLEQEIAGLQLQVQTAQRGCDELLRQGIAVDEEQFRKMAQSHEEWTRCAVRIEALTATLRAVAGTAEQQAELATRLHKTNIVAITAEKEQLQQARADLEKNAAANHKQVGSIELQLQQMSQDETLSRLLTIQSAKTAQIRRATREWAKLVLCRYLLEEARSIYERERQPSVIQEADKFLRLMTDSRYKMIAAIGGSDVQLEDVAKNIKGEITWSNGLADQVYLSIRFGLAQEFGRLVESVPLILDDILVKFDSTREKGAAKALLTVAKTQQILLFSCHERTLDIVKEVHRNGGYGDTPVAYYEVDHGKISRLLV